MTLIRFFILSAFFILIVSCKSTSNKTKYGKYDKDFYERFDPKQKIDQPDQRLIQRASEFGLKLNNGCYDSEQGIFKVKELDSTLIEWLKDYSTSDFCDKQRSRFSYFKELNFLELHKKQKKGKDYYLYLFKGFHLNKDELSKVVVVLNQKDQLFAVNTTLWK